MQNIESASVNLVRSLLDELDNLKAEMVKLGRSPEYLEAFRQELARIKNLRIEGRITFDESKDESIAALTVGFTVKHSKDQAA